MRYAALLALLLAASPAGGARIEYRCPPTLNGDGGRPLVLVERPDGVWRVDDPVPFVLGQGRFWRLVCAYRDARTADEVEAVVHWVSEPHEDGRLILEEVCADGELAAGALRSRRRQARAWASGPGAAGRLAREMLAAAEAVALPCPGTPDAPRVCPRWEVEEIYDDSRRRLCTWTQGPSTVPDPDDVFRYVYRSECRFGGFVTSDHVRRIAEGRFERSFVSVDRRTVRFVYDGDFESGGRVSGRFRWISAEGEQSPEMRFTAHCVDD